MSSLRNNYGKITSTSTRNLIRQMTNDGTNLGNTNAAVNGSVLPVDFWVQPLLNEEFIIDKFTLAVSDNSNAKHTDYGGIDGPLANGVQFFLKRNGFEILLGNSLKSNTGITQLLPIVQTLNFINNINFNLYTFDIGAPVNPPVVLGGRTEDRLGIRVQDDLSTLINHSCGVNGKVRLANV